LVLLSVRSLLKSQGNPSCKVLSAGLSLAVLGGLRTLAGLAGYLEEEVARQPVSRAAAAVSPLVGLLATSLASRLHSSVEHLLLLLRLLVLLPGLLLGLLLEDLMHLGNLLQVGSSVPKDL